MPTASTVAELVTRAVDRLTAAGVDSPRLDAELLLAQALGVERTGLLAYPDAAVGDGARETFEASIARRERGEPVAYIRGFREFHGLAFVTDARALIPRPETELLVDAALDEVAARLAGTPRAPGAPALRIADVGTGTGAIGVALLSSLRRRKMADEVMVIAIDVSEDALQLARENAVGHGVADRMVFMAADLLPYHVDPPYSVVCANLPYVPTGEIEGLARELSFEPSLALDGGPDGLDVVRRLLDALPRTLAPDGVAFLEIGAGHGEAIAHEVAARLPGWRCRVTDDLAGLPRLARVEPADPLAHAATRSVKNHRPAVRPEPRLPIQLLALDIDGTIVDHDFRISDRTVAAIRGAVERGVRVSLATGRMPSSAVLYANRLGLTEPIIGHQGAIVRAMPVHREPPPPDEAAPTFRGRVGRILHHEGLAPAVVREAIEWCRANGLDPHVNDREHIVVWRDDPSFEDYSGYLGPDAEIVPDLAGAIDRPMTKVISVGEPPRPRELYPVAQAYFAGRADATLSHPRFLEFVAPGVSKGKAVAWLAHRAGIPMAQVMTIGDAFNDIEMIGDAGHGAAMGTAPTAVRLAGRYIAPPVGEDGSASLIEQLILAPPDEAAANMARLTAEAEATQAELRAAQAAAAQG